MMTCAAWRTLRPHIEPSLEGLAILNAKDAHEALKLFDGYRAKMESGWR